MIVRVRNWSAWAPGVSRLPGNAPDVSMIPPLLRRRMSPLTRMSVAVAMDCCRRAKVPASEVQMVFASQHGEMGTTLKLLESLAAGEALSPMDFSGSVHHTALGYFTIAAANKRPARAVAGGEASFCYGFLDAMGLLAENDGSPVLLVAADEAVPFPFTKLVGKTKSPYAAAFLLERSRNRRKDAVSLELVSLKKADARPQAPAGIPALDFLRWFLKEKKSLEWHGSDRMWRWEK